MQEQIDEFLDYVATERGYSENTLAAYRNDLGQFAEFLSDYSTQKKKEPPTEWNQIDKNHIVDYMLAMKERGYASSTVARKVAATKSFFHFLKEEGSVTDDPTLKLESPKVKKHLPKAISIEDVERLLAEPTKSDSAKGLRDTALLETLYATGLRVSEVVSLNIEDVDLETGTIYCIGKGDRERVVPVYDQAALTIDAYLKNGRPVLVRNSEEKALFLNHRGERLTRQGLWLIIKQYVDTVGIEGDVTPHTLRHSFATHMLHGGAKLRDVQKLLGHANISTTQVYTQVTQDHLREAYNVAHPRA
ncbi:MAG: site-specific tyrosine recombinase XerD [Anaerolineae bacterium]|nr:site-specific tyrosine recombinase XerD [Anaerolineae bacterium]MCB9131419.1 site-specific tyrosine recombinase XerD [Anaerolineales bacterium]MCB0228657.1 site-specific tyrosine recombinase XerD [Anaerolineae bacterium]MCB0236482.1 site-specific tyrosine recombinase XerD [Anaerolineae bacterium]MCB0240382.1 site-specific tyrosine recombinase XerD [Anaerolineae bacterium]